MGQKPLIMNNDISNDVGQKEDGYQNTNLTFERTLFFEKKTPLIDWVPPLPTPVRPDGRWGDNL
jgi:hypothetical protein